MTRRAPWMPAGGGRAPDARRGGRSRALAVPVLLLALALAGCLPGGSAGERLYRRHCATCHGSDGGGGIQYLADEGANLIDGVWRYGGDPASIEMTLRDGQIARHPPWELSHQEIRELTDHVLALRGERR